MGSRDQRETMDDLDVLLAALPPEIVDAIHALPDRETLIEVVLDLGRRPEARYPSSEVTLLEREVVEADIAYVVDHIGSFGDDNRAGIERTLHRISAIRNRNGKVVGLTCRIGRAVYGTIEIIEDFIETGKSILIMGRPGIGKTPMLRTDAGLRPMLNQQLTAQQMIALLQEIAPMSSKVTIAQKKPIGRKRRRTKLSVPGVASENPPLKTSPERPIETTSTAQTTETPPVGGWVKLNV